MSEFILSHENREKLSALRLQYPHQKALLLPMLWMVQEQITYLSESGMQCIAQELDLPYMHVYSVASFYTMFHFEKPKKHLIEICRTLSCALNGKEEIQAYLEEKCKNSEDVEIIEVECLGACGGAPMCAVNGKYHENLNESKLDAILKELKC